MKSNPKQTLATLEELLGKLEERPTHNDRITLVKDRVHSLRDCLVGSMPAEYGLQLALAHEAGSALDEKDNDIKVLIKRLEA